jgi:Fur family zinc uptake transcriptional regulator
MSASMAEPITSYTPNIFLNNASMPKLTGNETIIYYALDSFNRATKAYELLDHLRPTGINAIPTVYRALNGLMKKGLVRYITTTQTYITLSEVCIEDDEERLFFVCSNCSHVSTVEAEDVVNELQANAEAAGFTIRAKSMEIIGLCSACKAKKV